MQRQSGVTLIELVIVMIIIGILAAIAVPSYRQYVIRSQRSDARDALLALATAQEKFYLRCNTYAADLASADSCADAELASPAISKNGWYELTIESGDGDSFQVAAEAVAGGAQFNDTRCRRFLVTDRGVRSAEDATGVTSAAINEACWE
jgi:type IV pilus assembly protein PilE